MLDCGAVAGLANAGQICLLSLSELEFKVLIAGSEMRRTHSANRSTVAVCGSLRAGEGWK